MFYKVYINTKIIHIYILETYLAIRGPKYLIKLIIKNKRITMLTSLLIIAIIIISSLSYIYIINLKDNNKKEEKETIKEIDDRISPYTEQALFVQIKRIRAKGIIEQMTDTGFLVKKVNDLALNDKGWLFNAKFQVNGLMAARYIRGLLPGRGWDEKPSFTYGAKIDDFEWMPEKRSFNSWDTGYIFNEFYKVVDEEQEKSDIEIRVLSGKNNKEIAESFNIEYDFRTGRWTGDDYFNDTDGYGHYDGEDYEVWFDVRQTDYDGDGIPYWTEVNVLGTDPKVDDRKLDHDGDGCSTAWEWKWGYDPFTWNNHTFLDPDGDGLQNVEEEYMQKWLANPFYPEIYIEVDYSADAPDETGIFGSYKIEMEKGKLIPIKRPTITKTILEGQEFVFWEESQQMLMERFNEHGITMHIDDGCMGEGGEKLDFIGGPGVSPEVVSISEYYNKDFPDERKGIFRYMIICLGGGYIYNMDYKGIYDTIVVQQSDRFYKGVGGNAVTPRSKRVAQAVSVLHELGHSCGFGYLHCGGVDNMSEGAYEKWYDYKSCMSYFWYSTRLFDYSDGTNGPNDVDDWGNLDVSFFQKPPEQYDLEGISFDRTAPPFNRGKRD